MSLKLPPCAEQIGNYTSTQMRCVCDPEWFGDFLTTLIQNDTWMT